MEEFYLDQEFEEKCKEAGIEPDDVRYYCNEGTIYEFNSQEELLKAAQIYLQLATKDPDGFRVEVTNVGGIHHLYSQYPPDVD